MNRSRSWRDSQTTREPKTSRQKTRHIDDLPRNAPPIELRNKAGWDSAKVDQNIKTYAERWARLMQLELGTGKKLSKIWERTSHAAEITDMSGESFRLATELLANNWKYGADLRDLYNRRFR